MDSKSKKRSLHSLSREHVISAEDFEAYKKVMFGESHRSGAIMASAFVERALQDLIMAHFINLNQNELNALFVDKGCDTRNIRGFNRHWLRYGHPFQRTTI
jgi:hypothetical protein